MTAPFVSPKHRNSWPGAFEDSVRPIDIARQMLPSLGYFGGVDANFAEATVKRKIRKLRFVLSGPAPEYLNLRGFVLRRTRPLDANNLVEYAALSSVREQDRDKDPAAAFTLGGIHSDRQIRPSWEAIFRQPVTVDAVRIYNRLDGVGRRSFAHEVWVTDEDGEDVRVGRRGGAETFQQTTRLLRSLVASRLDLSIPPTQEAQRAWRSDAVSALAGAIRGGEIPALTRTDSNLLFGLLPTAGGASLTEDDWFVLAYLLLQQRTRVPGSRTGIKSFGSVLNNEQMMNRLESRFGEVEQILGIEPHRIGDDGIHSDGPCEGLAP